jgi:hypothetical protein
MKEILQQLMDFQQELDSNNLVIKEKFEYQSTPADAAQIDTQRQLRRIEPSVLDYYAVQNGIDIKWKAADASLVENEMVGAVKLNLFSEVVKDWSGVVFFDNEPADSARRKFFPVDFFTDEAAAGFCTKEEYRAMMYFFQFEGDLIPLHVTFSSYLQLMLHAKACYYWQYLIMAIENKEENTVSERIKQYLPKVFPGFSFDDFEALYNKLRIK